MKIGILSDTHKKVKKARLAIELLKENGAEFIVHAGDIVEIKTLDLLKTSGLDYVAVYGNNDAHLFPFHSEYNLVQEPHYFTLDDTTFKLMHLPYYMVPDADVVIFGHTHQFATEFPNGTLFLNPGECCARNKPFSDCVLLEVTKKKFHVTHFSREKKAKEFKSTKSSYERVK